jgi:preprotein translocase SecE subunit
MNRSAPTDFLVETETEMKKVTWPTKDEASNASLVVIGTVVVIGCLLALFDVVLNFLFKFIF